MNYAAITDLPELEALLGKLLEEGRPVGFDIETGYDGEDQDKAALNPLLPESKLVGFSLTNDLSWSRYVPVAHDNGGNIPGGEAVWELFRPLAESGLVVAHNAKFEKRWLKHKAGLDLALRSDTMIEAYILAEWESVALKHLAKVVFGHEMMTFAELFPDLVKGKIKKARFNFLDVTPAVVSYASEDAIWALALHERNYPLCQAQGRRFLYEVESQLLPMLCEMEDYGVRYDWNAMIEAGARTEAFMVKQRLAIMAELSAMVGQPVDINLGSAAQLRTVLFDQLGMKSARMTKGSAKTAPQPSTDAIAMAALAKKHPVVQMILDWRGQKKLASTYLNKYPSVYRGAPDDRAHPNMLQTAVGTGRFAVSDPPYQQTPKHYRYELKDGSVFEFEFRDMIVADPGYYLLHYDYEQVELRVIAGEAQEPALLQRFRDGDDVHVLTASLMLGVPEAQITKDQRAIGKTMNFALLYGMGASSLADRLAITKDEAQALFDSYFRSYSAIGAWTEKQKDQGKRNGFTISKFGRVFTIWEFRDSNPKVYAKGERLTVNAPIQGGAADYMKIAMLRCWKALRSSGLADRVHCIMNNHDALTFEVEDSVKPDEVIAVIRPAVEFPVEGWPPITSEWAIGRTWGKMHTLVLDDNGRVVGLEGAKAVSAGEPDPDEEPEPIAVEIPPLPAPAPPPAPVSSPQQAAVAPQPTPAPSTPIEPSQPGQTLVVEITQMPTAEAFGRFKALLEQAPSTESTLRLVTPQGEIDFPSALGLGHAPHLSLIFGSAKTYYSQDSVDAGALTEGLTL